MTQTPTVELTVAAFEDTCLFQFPSLCAIPNLAHAVTSRPWNMACHQGPQIERTVERRKRVCTHLGLPFEGLTAPNQIHSPHVLRVRPEDVGAGREDRNTALRFVDGLICDLEDVALMQFSADCPILVLVEPSRRILATAHASWRGTVTQIATELVRQLRREFDIDPARLLAGLCPCAGPLEYEVGEEVRRIALARLPDAERFFPQEGRTWRFDMRSANVDQLIRAGLDPSNISVASISTMSDRRFYSHRRDGPETGRFALIAGFRAKQR
ncbi:MAG: polyphenol oxidase family protein [Phycisphaerales bacterium]|nr:polyphenol oxidase family protein [Phycisphaerales bacterium]